MSQEDTNFSAHLRGGQQITRQEHPAHMPTVSASLPAKQFMLSPEILKRNPNLWVLVTLAAMSHLAAVILLVKSWVASNMPFLLLTLFAVISAISAYLDYCLIQRMLAHRRQYHTQFKNRFVNRAALFALWVHAALTGMGLFVVGLPLMGYLILSLFYI